jgi:hypothetical protein
MVVQLSKLRHAAADHGDVRMYYVFLVLTYSACNTCTPMRATVCVCVTRILSHYDVQGDTV